MQYFSDGKTSGWNHIYVKAEYETTRDGPRLGIRWKISYSIDNYYYFGYNINAEVWTEGTNFGGQIKANYPNRGSGEIYYPGSGYYWFNKGYGVNEITGCRIIINSSNGGNINFDTGDDRTVITPTGYMASNINSNIDFNVGDNLNVAIDDPTNQNYTYNFYIDIYKEDNTWQNILTISNTNAKSFIADLNSIKDTIYSLMPNSKSRPIRANLETYINDTGLGMTTKTGTCYVVKSEPDVPDFILANASSNIISSVVAGYGPYNDKSNIFVCTKNVHNSAKNGANISKVLLDWGDGSPIQQINVEEG